MKFARSPQEISEMLVAAIDAGDTKAALELWSDDAMIVSNNGDQIRGSQAIAAVLESLVASEARLHIELGVVYETAQTAVAAGSLTTTVPDGEGNFFSQRSESIVVYSREQDGAWRVKIDFPWGLPAR